MGSTFYLKGYAAALLYEAQAPSRATANDSKRFPALSFEVRIWNCLLHSDLKTQGFHPKIFQDTLRASRPSNTLNNTDQHLLSKRAHT